MAEDKGRLKVLFGILGAALAVLIYANLPTSAPTPAARTPTVRGSVTPGQGGAVPAEVTAPEVHTEALAEARPQPGQSVRNLFRFRERYVPPPPATPLVRPTPSGPPPPPLIPPIGLKFIGLLEPPAGGRVAILSDGRGAPIYGKEGEALLGQYRILRIGTESIEMEYIDGRGRQSIRLSGS